MGEQELHQLLMQKQDRVLALTLELKETNGLLRKQAQLEAMELELGHRYGDLLQRMTSHETRVAECFRQAFTELQALLGEQEQGLVLRMERQLELVSRRLDQLELLLGDGAQALRPSP
ncbi:MAG: hypothetical protein ACKOPN_05195 [Prochlorococcaceae cyanobacterium]|jgi:hypothetical protein